MSDYSPTCQCSELPRMYINRNPKFMTTTLLAAIGPLYFLLTNSQTYMQCIEPSIPKDMPRKNLPAIKASKFCPAPCM